LNPIQRLIDKYPGWFFVLPALIVIFAIVVYPFAYALRLSFLSLSFQRPEMSGQFIGFGNYLSLLHDSKFWYSAQITLVYVVSVTVAEIVLGMAVALLFNRELKARRVLLSILMIPMILAPVVVGLMYSFLLNNEFGTFMYYIKQLGFFRQTSLFARPLATQVTIILMDIWEYTSFYALIMLAGLHALPKGPYEGAKVDGASDWQTFWWITIPTLMPLIVVATILCLIASFKTFDQIYILTGGGPSSATELLSIYAWRINFYYWNMGYGAATVMMIAAFTMIICGALYFVVQQRIKLF
jgi:multiple sugar transport system permease protein